MLNHFIRKYILRNKTDSNSLNQFLRDMTMYNDDADFFVDDVMIDDMMIERDAMVREARDKAEKKLTRLLLDLNDALGEHGLEIEERELQAFQDAIDELLASVDV
jgi:hypothetical protein